MIALPNMESELDVRQMVYPMLEAVLFLMLIVGVHEVGHAAAAFYLGVPWAEMELAFHGTRVSITLPQWFQGPGLAAVYYAGGLVAGLAALIAWAFWTLLYHWEPSPSRWFSGVLAAMATGWQFSAGLLEGKFHDSYMLEAGIPWSAPALLMGLSIVAALALHMALNRAALLHIPPRRKSLARFPDSVKQAQGYVSR